MVIHKLFNEVCMLNKVVVIGWDNFTASLAEGIKRSNPNCEILCADPSSIEIEMAVANRALSELPAQKSDIYADADFVIIHRSPQDTLKSISEIKSLIDSGTYVIDFQPVKSPFYKKSYDMLEGRYISCYVFLDNEPQGITVRGDLFKDKIVAVISDSSGKVLQDTRDFWNIFGAKIVPTSAEFFDEIIAETSQSVSLLAHVFSHVLLQDSWSDTLFFGFYNKKLREFLSPAITSTPVKPDDIINNADNIRRNIGFIRRELDRIDQMIDNEDAFKLSQYLHDSITFKNRL